MIAVTTWCRQAFGRLGGSGGVGDVVSVSATGELKPEGDLVKNRRFFPPSTKRQNKVERLQQDIFPRLFNS
jgi:hypothetical protein